MNLSFLKRNKRQKTKFQMKVVKRKVLPATIDGHLPLLVRFQIDGPKGRFYITTVCVNWGRGYAPGEFQKNVLNVLDRVDGVEYVILLMQEIDETDRAEEGNFIKSQVVKGTTLVEWGTREPIAVSPGVKTWRHRKVMTMDQGSKIGAPKDTGPRRFLVSCLAEIEGVTFWFGNQHPHRVPTQASKAGQNVVINARKRGVKITRREVRKALKLADVAIYGGDMNDPDYPSVHPNEEVAVQRKLDTVRYSVAA